MTKEKDEYLKKILQEADTQTPLDEHMLKVFVKNASNLQMEAQPPAGYESYLLKSLRDQLPNNKKSSSKDRGIASLQIVGDFLNFLRSPQLAWSVSGVLTLFIGVFFASQIFINGKKEGSLPIANSTGDVLNRAVSRLGTQKTGEWLASLGDSGTRAKNGESLSNLADEMGAANNQEAMNRVLINVAHEMGMNDF